MKKAVFIGLIALVSVAVNWLALLAGWWWITPIIGLFLRPAYVSLLLALCAGGLGWGLPLAVLAINAPVKSIANIVESVIGLSATGGVLIIVSTILLGCVLSAAGTWVGIAGRRVTAVVSLIRWLSEVQSRISEMGRTPLR
ncbi:MAG TPA: hypothetical protein VGF67_27730 [Ktedonobacteraceae bacterium]|jgi:hypothetical protein